MENKYKKLATNSIIFAIGNFGSKIISFVMLPVYTYKMSTTEFGTADLIITAVALLAPVVSLSIFDSVLRYSMDKNKNSKEVFSNSMFITLLSCLILIVAYLLCLALGIGINIRYVILLLVLQIFQTLLNQYTRAIGAIKEFALNGILMTLVTSIMNIILLVKYDLGISGYMYSIFLANIASIIYLFYVIDVSNEFKIRLINFNQIKLQLSYSIPLIPNSIAWWLTNMGSRYFIVLFIGASANGLFAVANKLPTILSVINSLFYQSWQLSAIEEYESKDKSIFYTSVFNNYSQLLFISTSAIILILKPLIELSVSDEFSMAWKYVPFLLLTTVFSSFSSFLGTNYIASKETKGAFLTTVFGAVINVILSALLIPFIGLNGAGLSSSISFFILWLVRVKDTKKYVNIIIDSKNFIGNIICISLQIISLYFFNGLVLFIIELCLFIINLLVNRGLSQLLIKTIKSKVS